MKPDCRSLVCLLCVFQFDDGDMLVCRDSQQRWSLVGVMSEYSCGNALPILFTDVRPYVDVILQEL